MAEYNDRGAVIEGIKQPGVVAIIRTNSPDVELIIDATHAMLAGGIHALEITLTIPGALGLIRKLNTVFGSNILLGSGSVITVEAGLHTIDAGARFVVTPVTRPEIVKACREAGAVVACGAYTPTEALNAHEAGADFVKIFPAEDLGARYIKSLLAPLPHLQIIPTGGVEVGNCGDFIKAGCAAVAVGSHLMSNDLLKSRNWTILTERCQAYVAAMKIAHKVVQNRA